MQANQRPLVFNDRPAAAVSPALPAFDRALADPTLLTVPGTRGVPLVIFSVDTLAVEPRRQSRVGARSKRDNRFQRETSKVVGVAVLGRALGHAAKVGITDIQSSVP